MSRRRVERKKRVVTSGRVSVWSFPVLFLTLRVAARELSSTQQSVQRLIDEGLLLPVSAAGRQMIPLSEVRRLLALRRESDPPR